MSVSPLSFMVGIRPTGWGEFVEVAHPAGVYGISNCPIPPNGLGVLRIQNDVWSRLPDACGVDRYFESQDPIASAEYELIGKTQYIPKQGDMTLIDLWRLSGATWCAPYNEWALDFGPDAIKKAQWMNNWTCRALDIAHAAGVKLCIGSFATGNPDLSLLPYLYPMFRLAKLYGGILDVHEYGVEAALMTSPSSGAFRYRQLYAALPADCKLPIVVSEFWWGNGFEVDNVAAQVEDARQYGLEIVKDDYLLWASAFQLDDGKENDFTSDAVTAYATAAASVQRTENTTMSKGGLHLSALGNHPDDPSLPFEIQAMKAAKINRAKFMSNGDPTFVHALVAAGMDMAGCVVRLFAQGDNPSLLNWSDFYSQNKPYLTEVYEHGVRMFEIHNEPNLQQEGFGYAWKTPAEFATFYAGVARMIMADFPQAQLIYPGLSPQPDYALWLPSIATLIVAGLVQFVGVHCYWSSVDLMRDASQGKTYLRFTGLGRDLIITEASHNVPNATEAAMGAEYAEYIATLPSYVNGVFFFVSYGPAFDASGETWVRGDGATIHLTGIPAAVGAGVVTSDRELYYWLDVDSGVNLGNANPISILMTKNRNIRAITRPKVTPPSTVVLVTSTDGFGTVTGAGAYALNATATVEWKP